MNKIVRRLRSDAPRVRAAYSISIAMNMEEAADEIERLQLALAECSADYRSPETTVMGAAAHVGREFQRRMELAAAALSDEQPSGETEA